MPKDKILEFARDFCGIFAGVLFALLCTQKPGRGLLTTDPIICILLLMLAVLMSLLTWAIHKAMMDARLHKNTFRTQ